MWVTACFKSWYATFALCGCNEYRLTVDPLIFEDDEDQVESKTQRRVNTLLAEQGCITTCEDYRCINNITGVQSLHIAANPTCNANANSTSSASQTNNTRYYKKSTFPTCYNESFYCYVEWLMQCVSNAQNKALLPTNVRVHQLGASEQHRSARLTRFIIKHQHQEGCSKFEHPIFGLTGSICKCDPEATIQVMLVLAEPQEKSKASVLPTIITCFPLGVNYFDAHYPRSLPTQFSYWGDSKATSNSDDDDVDSSKPAKSYITREKVITNMAEKQLTCIDHCMHPNEKKAREQHQMFYRNERGMCCLQHAVDKDFQIDVPVVPWEKRYTAAQEIAASTARLLNRIESCWKIKRFEVMLKNIKREFCVLTNLLISLNIQANLDQLAEEIRTTTLTSQAQECIHSGNATELQKLKAITALLPLITFVMQLAETVKTTSPSDAPAIVENSINIMQTILEIQAKVEKALKELTARNNPTVKKLIEAVKKELNAIMDKLAKA